MPFHYCIQEKKDANSDFLHCNKPFSLQDQQFERDNRATEANLWEEHPSNDDKN